MSAQRVFAKKVDLNSYFSIQELNMKVGRLPHKVSYTHHVKGGEQYMFTSRINPKFRNDKWMHVHEYQHIKQWYLVTFIGLCLFGVLAYMVNYDLAYLGLVSPFLHKALYQTKPYRKWAEVQAFRAELPYHETDKTEHLASILANSYGLDITEAQALKLLR